MQTVQRTLISLKEYCSWSRSNVSKSGLLQFCGLLRANLDVKKVVTMLNPTFLSVRAALLRYYSMPHR